jgi:chromosome segregation ATPase
MNTNDLVAKLAQTEKKSEELQATVTEKDTKIAELNKKIDVYENQIGIMLNNEDDHHKNITEHEKTIQKLLDDHKQAAQQYESKVKELEANIEKMKKEDRKEDAQYERRIKELEGTITRLTKDDEKEDKMYEQKIKELEGTIAKMKREDKKEDYAYEQKIQELEGIIVGLRQSEEVLQKQLENVWDNKYVEQLKKSQVEKDLQINDLNNQIVVLNQNEESKVTFNIELTTNLKALEEKLGEMDKHKDTLLIENNGGADDNQDIVKVGEDISEIRMLENKEDKIVEMNKLLESQQDRISELTKGYNNEKNELVNFFEQERKKYEDKISNMRQSIQEVKTKLEAELSKRNEMMQGVSKQLEE